MTLFLLLLDRSIRDWTGDTIRKAPKAVVGTVLAAATEAVPVVGPLVGLAVTEAIFANGKKK
jgi:hypothetical protein